MIVDISKIMARWSRLSLRWKVSVIAAAFVFILLASRSIIFTALAWLIIIYFIAKLIFDFEMF